MSWRDKIAKVIAGSPQEYEALLKNYGTHETALAETQRNIADWQDHIARKRAAGRGPESMALSENRLAEQQRLLDVLNNFGPAPPPAPDVTKYMLPGMAPAAGFGALAAQDQYGQEAQQ